MNRKKLYTIRRMVDKGVLYEGCPSSPDGYTTVWNFYLVKGSSISDLDKSLQGEYSLKGKVQL